MKKETMQLRVFSLQQELLGTFSKVFSKGYILITALMIVLIMNTVPVFATGNGTIFTDMATQLTKMYEDFLPVINICALILGGFAGLMFMFSSNEKTSQTAKSWLIRIGVGWIIISVFPYILIQGRNLLGSSATGKSANDIKQIKPGS